MFELIGILLIMSTISCIITHDAPKANIRASVPMVTVNIFNNWALIDVRIFASLFSVYAWAFVMALFKGINVARAAEYAHTMPHIVDFYLALLETLFID